jgi:hypothetical protein
LINGLRLIERMLENTFTKFTAQKLGKLTWLGHLEFSGGLQLFSPSIWLVYRSLSLLLSYLPKMNLGHNQHKEIQTIFVKLLTVETVSMSSRCGDLNSNSNTKNWSISRHLLVFHVLPPISNLKMWPLRADNVEICNKVLKRRSDWCESCNRRLFWTCRFNAHAPAGVSLWSWRHLRIENLTKKRCFACLHAPFDHFDEKSIQKHIENNTETWEIVTECFNC